MQATPSGSPSRATPLHNTHAVAHGFVTSNRTSNFFLGAPQRPWMSSATHPPLSAAPHHSKRRQPQARSGTIPLGHTSAEQHQSGVATSTLAAVLGPNAAQDGAFRNLSLSSATPQEDSNAQSESRVAMNPVCSPGISQNPAIVQAITGSAPDVSLHINAHPSTHDQPVPPQHPS